MNQFIMQSLAPICVKLFAMSCTATLIGAVIVLLRHFFDAKIPPQWKNALWCLVLVALIVPYRIPSPLALSPTLSTLQIPQATFQLFLQGQEHLQVIIPAQPQQKPSIQLPTQAQTSTPLFPGQSDPNSQTITTAPTHAEQTNPSPFSPALLCALILPSIWLLGVLFSTLYGLLCHYHLTQCLRHAQKPCNAETQALFSSSKKSLGITKDIALFTQDYIQTPAILGLFHPTIVLPDYANNFSADTMRFVLLHELSHFKRKDLWYHTLLLVLQSIYWFNPAIWLLFRFMRQDIELCNDHTVLRIMGQTAQKRYASSLLTVLGQYNHIPFAPRLLCMADSKHTMKRRIQMMQSNKNFHKHRIAISAACLAVITVLAIVFFTTPVATNGGTSSNPSSASDTSSSASDTSSSNDTSSSASGSSSVATSQDTSASSDASSSEAESSSASTAQPTATSAPIPCTITMMLEGVEENVSAMQYEKEGYSIPIPVDEWVETDTNSWQAKNNKQVKFSMLCLAEQDFAAVATNHWGNAGEESSWLDLPARFFDTDNGQTHILLFAGNDQNTYYYMLAECPAEAIEGYGIRMAYIAANLKTHRASNVAPTLVSFADGLSDTTYTVFDSYTINDQNTLDASFCISDAAGTEIQTISYTTHFDQSWYNTYLDNCGVMVRFLDVNFDGHLDFVGQVFGAMVDQSYQVWLYQENSKQFAYSEEYSAQTNPVYNPETKLLLSTSYANLGLPFYSLFHVEDGHLAYLGSIQGAATEAGAIEYIERMYGEQQQDGSITYREVQTMVTVTTPEECSPLWNGFNLNLET